MNGQILVGENQSHVVPTKKSKAGHTNQCITIATRITGSLLPNFSCRGRKLINYSHLNHFSFLYIYIYFVLFTCSGPKFIHIHEFCDIIKIRKNKHICEKQKILLLLFLFFEKQNPFFFI